MRVLFVTILIAILSVGNVAFAHSPLKETKPTDGAQLDSAPSQISFIFMRNLRLTKVTASKSGGEAIRLDMAGQKKFATEFVLPFFGSSSGEYLIEWRGLGDDGHAQKGTFSFTVK